MSDTQVRSATMNIEGMTCEHCAGKVKQALEQVSGVSKAQVDLATKTARIELSGEASLASVMRAVGQAGYSVTGFTRNAK